MSNFDLTKKEIMWLMETYAPVKENCGCGQDPCKTYGSKEDQLKHKKEMQTYRNGIKEIEKEAKLALKKFEAIKIAPGTPRFGMFG